MDVSSDYEDLFRALNTNKIKYLIIGAHAVIFYTEPRFTKDIDIWIPPELNKVENVYQAFKDFGTPLKNFSPEDFADKKMILQIGVAPIRVDIFIDLPGVLWRRAWTNRKRSRYGKTPIHILGVHELILAKRNAGRPQDQLDLKKLLKKI